jgi:hypothetical protein
MSISKSMKTLAGVAVATLLVASQAQAIIAYSYPTTMVGNQSGGPYILGNEFVVNSPISVTAVGAFESGGSLGATVPVALYQLSGTTWNQVGGTYESFSGTVGTLVGNNARFQNLASPVTLNAGTYAIVAANYGAPGAMNWNNNVSPVGGPITFNTGAGAITMAGPSVSAFWASGSTLGPTLSGVNEGNWEYPNPTFAGATFDFNFTPVPEVAHFALAGVGLLGLVYVGRYARLRRMIKPA